MHKQPWFYPLWALVAFWAWALHVATGFMNNLISAHSGKRSSIIRTLDSFTQAILVDPFGRPFSVAVLIVVGAMSAFWIYRSREGSVT